MAGSVQQEPIRGLRALIEPIDDAISEEEIEKIVDKINKVPPINVELYITKIKEHKSDFS
jgi:hypothetical protein